MLIDKNISPDNFVYLNAAYVLGVLLRDHELSLAEECSDMLITIDEDHKAEKNAPSSLKDEAFIKSLFGITG